MGLTLNEMYIKKHTDFNDGKIILMPKEEKADWVKVIRKTLEKYHFPEVWHGYPPVCPTHKIVLKTK
tara:strand:- start:2853 stop:3053 length:201 start_codon:yes stop_codon:yes gene_type:complete